MRCRYLRWLSRLLFLLLLIVVLGSGLLWFRSHQKWVIYPLSKADARRWSLFFARNGSAAFVLSSNELSPVLGSSDAYLRLMQRLSIRYLEQMELERRISPDGLHYRRCWRPVFQPEDIITGQVEALEKYLSTQGIGGFFVYFSAQPKIEMAVRIPLWVPTCAGSAIAFCWLWYNRPWLRRYRIRRGLCIDCAYDLTGLASARCPECGTSNPGVERKNLQERASPSIIPTNATL